MSRLTLLIVTMTLATLTAGPVGAATIVFLADYEVTGDPADVVHLGDQYITDFVAPANSGTIYTATFDLPTPALPGGGLAVHADHFQSNPDQGYYNHVYINGTSIGYLAHSPVHWLSDTLTGSADLLQPTGNIFTIRCGVKSSNDDDFEFTDLYLTYDVPEPCTLVLFAALGAAALRRRM